MSSSFLSILEKNKNVIGSVCLLNNGFPYYSYGSFQNQNEIYAFLSHCIENQDSNSFSFHDSMFRVIQRDNCHIIALTSPIGRQKAIEVKLTAYGRIAIEFYWNPPSVSQEILKSIDELCKLV